MKKTLLTLTAALLIISIAGCAMGNKGTINYSRTTTIGQELIDLKLAKDQDAISEAEYKKAKENLLKCQFTFDLKCSNEKKKESSSD